MLMPLIPLRWIQKLKRGKKRDTFDRYCIFSIVRNKKAVADAHKHSSGISAQQKKFHMWGNTAHCLFYQLWERLVLFIQTSKMEEGQKKAYLYEIVKGLTLLLANMYCMMRYSATTQNAQCVLKVRVGLRWPFWTMLGVFEEPDRLAGLSPAPPFAALQTGYTTFVWWKDE